ncbi:MAG TPA: response regulator transcription factor [Terriglobales bacterium]|jgi:DNA-binding response OmpR family regulator|nr:response regulator transcription factor [Terriglobales bacterium]
MKVLVAEDDPVFQRYLQRLLAADFEVVLASNGCEALEGLRQPDGPRLAVLDWMMPEMDGPEVCRKVRQLADVCHYLILLTAKDKTGHVVSALEAGADDYVTKPFDPLELKARLRVGVRLLELQTALAARVRELQEALANVKLLQGLLPICSYCKRIRDDQNYWQQLETYFGQHTEASFSHGICPECYEKHLKPDLERFVRP